MISLKWIKNTSMSLLFIISIILPLIIGTIFGIWQIRPPKADETSASYQRMMYNVERWTQETHPVGSDELARIRLEIIAEIEDMGLTPILHDTYFTNNEVIESRNRLFQIRGSDRTTGRSITAPPILARNIFVVLESPNTDRGIMFVSHYDSNSRNNTPGAADSMVGVCAILEALRVHAGNDNLENSLYFLFTDSEETAAMGALAFVSEFDELRDKVDMVINLDAGGNRGGLLVHMTSSNAYNIINMYRKTVNRPMGFSAAVAVNRTIMNGFYTDMDYFVHYGWKGIDLAINEGRVNYHAITDTFENLNRDSAGHYLTTVLGLADYAAGNSLESLRRPSSEAVFFTFFGSLALLSYSWAYIFCAIACMLVFAFFLYEHKIKRLRVSLSNIHMLAVTVLSIVNAIFLHEASYLFWLPLLAMVVTAFMKKWEVAYRVGQMVSRITTLLLWIPAAFIISNLQYDDILLQLFIIFQILLVYIISCLGGRRKRYR